MFACLVRMKHVQVTSKSMQALLQQIDNTNLPKNLHTPELKEHISLLEQMQAPAILKLHELDNSQLIKLVKHYATYQLSSEDLYSAVASQFFKRAHSFTLDELVELVYFMARTGGNERIFSVADNLIVKDPFKITPGLAGKISFAYGLRNEGSETLWKALANVFKVGYQDFSLDEGLLFVTGVQKKQYKDIQLLTVIENWGKNHVEEMDPLQFTQLLYSFLKLNTSSSSLKALEERIPVQDMYSREVEKLLGCYLVHNRKLPNNLLLERALWLISNSQVSPAELSHLIYTLRGYPDTQEHFHEINKLLLETLELCNPQELVSLFVAVVSTGTETSEVLGAFKANFRDISPQQLLKVVSSLARRGKLFKEATEPILNQALVFVKARNLSTSEFTFLMYCLCKLNYQNKAFWDEALRQAKFFRVENADEYMQLYLTVKDLAQLGVDPTKTLNYLETSYEKTDNK